MARTLAVFATVLIAAVIASPIAFHAQAQAQAQAQADIREAACARKPAASERAICLDRELTRLDAELNGVYGELRQAATQTQFAPVRTEQRQWLKERDRCGERLDCLAEKYQDRIAVLEQAVENLAFPNKSHVEIGCTGEDQVFVDGECRSGTSVQPNCNEFGTLKSQNSKTPVTVTFVNKTAAYRGVMWLNFEGRPVEYTNLEAGQSYTINTYLTHPWMFTDGPGNCIEIVMPAAGGATFEIKVPSPAFGPDND